MVLQKQRAVNEIIVASVLLCTDAILVVFQRKNGNNLIINYNLRRVSCTEGKRLQSVWGMNFAACIRMRKSGIDANWTQ